MRLLDQVLIPRLMAPLWLRRNGVRDFLREYEATQRWSAELIQELQLRRLKELLHFANENCPFYRERFRAAGFDPRGLRSVEDLRVLPVLTKEDIRANFVGLQPARLDPKSYIVNFTGGSSGSPLQFLVTKERMASRNASTIRHDRWAGWNFGTPSGYLWGYPPEVPVPSVRERLTNLLFYRRTFLDTFDVKQEEVDNFVRWLRSEQEVVLVAYARSLLWFCQYLKRQGLGGFSIKSAILSAESVSAEERQLIESVLRCPTFERYGCREFAVVASECEARDGMHLCSDTLLVEFNAGGRAALPGEAGEILVTDLLNTAMPMIRYRIGDVGAPMAGSCGCGRGLPRMAMVAGRVTDFIHTPDGRWLSGIAINTYLISKMPAVRQVQIRQDRCDQIRILAVSDGGDKEVFARFLSVEIPRMFGSRMTYAVEWVDNIPREASGKYRVTVSACATAHGFSLAGGGTPS